LIALPPSDKILRPWRYDRSETPAQQTLHRARTRKRPGAIPAALHRIALEKLVLLDAATKLDDLAAWPSLRLEKLKGDRRAQHSIRINSQYRICFVWREPDAFEVEIVDYH
jgi:proteic killer suppression protein